MAPPCTTRPGSTRTSAPVGSPARTVARLSPPALRRCTPAQRTLSASSPPRTPPSARRATPRPIRPAPPRRPAHTEPSRLFPVFVDSLNPNARHPIPMRGWRQHVGMRHAIDRPPRPPPLPHIRNPGPDLWHHRALTIPTPHTATTAPPCRAALSPHPGNSRPPPGSGATPIPFRLPRRQALLVLCRPPVVQGTHGEEHRPQVRHRRHLGDLKGRVRRDLRQPDDQSLLRLAVPHLRDGLPIRHVLELGLGADGFSRLPVQNRQLAVDAGQQVQCARVPMHPP